MWTENDKRFLRIIRIDGADPPAPLPRFRVEPSDVDERGYRVYDTNRWIRVATRRRRYHVVYEIGPKEFADPLSAAEDLARQMNDRHLTQL